MSKTYYVCSFRFWLDSQKRWSARVGVSEDCPTPSSDLLKAYEVDATSRAEAMGLVFEWLVRNHPRSMNVTEVSI